MERIEERKAIPKTKVIRPKFDRNPSWKEEYIERFGEIRFSEEMRKRKVAYYQIWNSRY